MVIGTSGAGKTTLARRLSTQLGVLHIELDAINWQPGWRDLTRHAPEEFIRRVTLATEAPAWVADGNYGTVRDLLWSRATHLVWLDLSRSVIMRRVIIRSVRRALLRTELWAGNRERWSHFLNPDHPIRWAWSTHARRRTETTQRLTEPAYSHLTVLHLRYPRDAQHLVL